MRLFHDFILLYSYKRCKSLIEYYYKTKYKCVKGKELFYALEKGKFNSLYGMTVTNMIRDEVLYDDKSGWSEQELSNTDIFDGLLKEEEKAFLSFAWGVWITAYARENLLRRVIDLDEYAVYMDTDSLNNSRYIYYINKSNNYKINIVSKEDIVIAIILTEVQSE